MSLNPPDYMISRLCFVSAALVLLGRLGWWLATEHFGNRLHGVALAFMVFGIIGVLLVVSMQWVSEREHAWNKQMAPKKETSKIVPNQAHPSLHDLFKTDFNTLLSKPTEIKAKLINNNTITIYATEYFDFQGKSKFLGYYIPPSGLSDNSYIACKLILDEYKNTMNHLESNTVIVGGFTGDSQQTSSKDLLFSGRVYIYHDDMFSLQQLAALEREYQSRGLSVVFRGNEYLVARWNNK